MWDNNSDGCCTACHKIARQNSSFVDKENLPPTLSPAKSEDMSFYGSSAPIEPLYTNTSPNHCLHFVGRRSLDDHDPNSRDSGYFNGDNGRFSSFTSPSRGLSRLSFETGSVGSMEDDLLEEFSDIEPLEDNLPQDFNKLITGPISNQQRSRPISTQARISPRELALRPLFRRALSLQNENTSTTPNSSRVRSCLFKTVADSRPFKRPDPPMELDTPPNNVKKQKFEDTGTALFHFFENKIAAIPTAAPPKRILQRAISATEESIMSAVQRSSTEPDLIGDFSKTFCLPLTLGRHQDLKSITPGTLAQLMNGVFAANVASFKVIDCRYPYEYEGGHIEGAINIYTKEQCLELLKNVATTEDDPDKRSNILVFHCEFSSERGPNLCRYLRKEDRILNQDAYPSLHFPECYILEGGYKKFFEQYSNLCVPIAYKEMLHPEHESELRFFRQKSKTLNLDTRQRPPQRNSLKKLGL